MTILLGINSLAFVCLSIVLFFKFKKTPNKQELVELTTQLADIKIKIEALVEKKFVEDNFTPSSAFKAFSDNLKVQLNQNNIETQKIMEEIIELEKSNESKITKEEVNEEFVSKGTADDVFVKKEDAENVKAEISSQLQEIGKSLSELQKAIEDMKSNTIPEAFSQLLDKGKEAIDMFLKDVKAIASNSSDLKPELQNKELTPDTKVEILAAETNTPSVEKEKDLTFDNQIKAKQIVLSNGKMNQPYKFPFDISTFGIADIGDFVFVGLDAIGLTYDKETKEIIGVPTVSGDHKIKIEIKRSDWSEGKPKFARELNLTVNPDPKSLWKNLPTPTDVEYYKLDEDMLFIKVEAKNGNACKDMVAASQRGRSFHPA